jgi:phosphoglycolate phosphatase-like HAD superfamily hydrolase
MPGIVDVLDALDRRDDVVQGLGTGNFRRAGELKLRHFEIARYFPGCIGGFGEDSEDRHEVIGAGIERLRNGDGAASRVVVIGDTPHDVSAAKANGAFALGVATGRDSVDDLLACGADAALADLADVERAVDIICGG